MGDCIVSRGLRVNIRPMKRVFLIVLLLPVPALCGTVPPDSLLPDSVVTRLMSVPRESSDYAEARRRLAGHFLSIGTVSGREKAEQCARDAVAANRRSLEARSLLVRVLYGRGAMKAMVEACEDILKNDDWEGPLHEAYAEACYYKGLAAERSALKYKDMIDIIEPSSGQYVSLMAYGYEDMRIAAGYFEQALRHRADHRDAMIHLALLYMEIEDYESMRIWTTWRLRRNPFDHEACLYAAYAEYHLGRADASASLYRRAFMHMNSDELRPYQHDTIRTRASDPLFLTSEDERQLEHYNRVTYANLRFQRFRSSEPGVRSERGRLYLRYGRPDVMYSVKPDFGMLGGAQVWQYDRFILQFRDDFASGRFLLDDRSVLESENLIHTMPDRFVWPERLRGDLRNRLFQFRHATGQTRLMAFAESDAGPADASAQGGLFLTDSTGKPVGEIRTRFTKSARYSFELVAPAGTSVGGFSIEIMADSSQRRAVQRGSLAVRDFSGAHLQLSDVVLGHLTDDKRVWPLFTDTVRIRHPLHLYFEMYNLTVDDSGQSRFRVEATVTMKSPGFFRSLFSPHRYQVTSSTVMTGTSVNESSSLGLELAQLEPGPYEVRVRVIDLHSQTQAETSEQLVVLVP